MSIAKSTVRSMLMFSCVAGLCLSAAGEIVLQADFKDPANPVVKGGKGALVNWRAGSGEIKDGVMIVTQQENTPAGQLAGIKVKPEAPANSMEAMFKDWELNGAIDFFVSSSLGLDKESPVNLFRPVDQNNLANGGMRLVLMNVKDEFRVELIGKDATSLIMANGKAEKVLAYHSKTPMEPNKMYHIAITFQTDENGVITSKLYFAPADQDIATDKDKPVKTYSFRLNPSVKAGFGTGDFSYGQLSTGGRGSFTNRFGRITVYNSVPATFSKL